MAFLSVAALLVAAAACVLANTQSPINIQSSDAVDAELSPLSFKHYHSSQSSYYLANTGHGCQITLKNWLYNPKVKGGPLPRTFVLEQVHFHWGASDGVGSEHYLNGVPASMEVHLVHWNSKYASYSEASTKADGLAVIGFFIECADCSLTASRRRRLLCSAGRLAPGGVSLLAGHELRPSTASVSRGARSGGSTLSGAPGPRGNRTSGASGAHRRKSLARSNSTPSWSPPAGADPTAPPRAGGSPTPRVARGTRGSRTSVTQSTSAPTSATHGVGVHRPSRGTDATQRHSTVQGGRARTPVRRAAVGNVTAMTTRRGSSPITTRGPRATSSADALSGLLQGRSGLWDSLRLGLGHDVAQTSRPQLGHLQLGHLLRELLPGGAERTLPRRPAWLQMLCSAGEPSWLRVSSLMSRYLPTVNARIRSRLFPTGIDNYRNPDFQKLVNVIPKIAAEDSEKIEVHADLLAWVVPYLERTGYYTYAGSLTTSPYSENVLWIVYENPIPIGKSQIAPFRSIENHDSEALTTNFRQLQEADGVEVRYVA